MLFHLVTSPSVHMHENCYFCSTLLSLFNESIVHNEFDVVLLLLLFAWFYFMDSVLWIIIFYCVASVIKNENTKIYYLVVVIMIEKSFFYVKNSYKSFVISLTKCKTS